MSLANEIDKYLRENRVVHYECPQAEQLLIKASERLKILDMPVRRKISESTEPVAQASNNASDEICSHCGGTGYVRLFANCSPFKCGACHGSGKPSPVA